MIDKSDEAFQMAFYNQLETVYAQTHTQRLISTMEQTAGAAPLAYII